MLQRRVRSSVRGGRRYGVDAQDGATPTSSSMRDATSHPRTSNARCFNRISSARGAASIPLSVTGGDISRANGQMGGTLDPCRV